MGQILSSRSVDPKQAQEEIHKAIQLGDLKQLQSYCSENFDFDVLLGGSTLLHYAVRYRQLECVKYLLDRGADPNMTNVSVRPVLFELFSARVGRKFNESDDLPVVRALLKRKADINARNSAQRTPLLKSIIECQHHITAFLLVHKADVNIGDVDGLLPIHVSATYSSVHLLRRLLDCGADINGQDVRGRTALYYSILSGHADIFKELLANSSNVNLSSDLGCPLQVAVVASQRDMVHNLLENDAFVGCTVHESRFVVLRKSTDILNLALTILHIKLVKVVADSTKPFAEVERATDILELIIQAHGNSVPIQYNAFVQATYLTNLSASRQYNARMVFKIQNLCYKLGFLIKMSRQKVRAQIQRSVFDLDDDYLKDPLTLQNMCRVRVRELLMRSKTNVVGAVKKLDCSVVIKDILLLKDVFRSPW